MNSITYKSKMKKISEKDYDEINYSRRVTERFLELLPKKIMLNDRMLLIQKLCNEMNPLTVAEYSKSSNEYTSYNGVVGAIQAKKLMSFRIGNILFLPKQ